MIGEHIQRLRKEKGLSMSELADRAKVAKSYLSSIERGIQTNPSIQFLEKIAVVLEIDVQALLGLTTTASVPSVQAEEIEQEWLNLAREAMESGITKEQFREFLEYNKWRLQNQNKSQ